MIESKIYLYKRNIMFTNKLIIFFAFIFFKFSLINCVYISKIDQQCLKHLEEDCSKEEKEYFERILKRQDLSFLGNYNFLELFENPILEKKDKTEVLVAPLAIFNGYIWDYKLERNILKDVISGTRRRKGHQYYEQIDSQDIIKIYYWLKSFIESDGSWCIIC